MLRGKLKLIADRDINIQNKIGKENPDNYFGSSNSSNENISDIEDLD